MILVLNLLDIVWCGWPKLAPSTPIIIESYCKQPKKTLHSLTNHNENPKWIIFNRQIVINEIVTIAKPHTLKIINQM